MTFARAVSGTEVQAGSSSRLTLWFVSPRLSRLILVTELGRASSITLVLHSSCATPIAEWSARDGYHTSTASHCATQNKRTSYR